MIREAHVLSRPQKLYVVCTAVFLTALVVAEATASKLFTVADLPFTLTILGQEFTSITMTAGVIAFPITFIVTDLLNEYYGKRGIRFVTFIGMAMICFEFVLLKVALEVPVAENSPVSQGAFYEVFGASTRVIIGSLIAYLVGQLVDIFLFHWFRNLTDGRFLWLRATGSTFGSQFIDTFIVLTVAFYGQLTAGEIIAISLFNYMYKFLIAVGITPIIYLAHWMMDEYLGEEKAEELRQRAERGESAPLRQDRLVYGASLRLDGPHTESSVRKYAPPQVARRSLLPVPDEEETVARQTLDEGPLRRSHREKQNPGPADER